MKLKGLDRISVVAIIAAAIMTILMWFFHLTDCAENMLLNDAHGEEPSEAAVISAVRQLRPEYSPPVAATWAGVLYEAAMETDLDPLLVTSIAFRESSLRDDVVGPMGELGPMQLHGVSRRHAPRGCDAAEMRCNIRGGSAYLQWCRAHCGGSWSRWVGAYGMSRCPTEDEAATLRSVKRARSIYERIGGKNWE